MVDAFPDALVADRAVEMLGLHDPDPVDWLEAAAERHADASVGDNALWWAAQAAIRRFGDVGRGRRLLRALTRRFPGSPYVDDALWLLGALYRALGDSARAEACYASLVEIRGESSWFVGSYHSVYLDDAALWIGHLRFDRGELAGARAAYRWLLSRLETSTLRDDAWWGIASAEARLGQDPSVAARRLIEAHPDSRYAAAARRLLGGELDAAARPDVERSLAPALDVDHLGAP